MVQWNKRIIRSVALALTGLVCSAVNASSKVVSDFVDAMYNPSVVTVDGCPVHLDEFSWFMQQERAAVFRAVTADYPLDSEANFWDQDCDGMTPRKILLENTVAKVVREKCEQLLLKEWGLIDDIRYSVFIEYLKELNDQRQKAAEAGKVIFGPVQYSPRQYYSHWMATMQIKAKDKLRKEQPDQHEAQLRDYYNQKKQQYKRAAAWTLEILVVRNKEDASSQRIGIESVAEDIMLKGRQERALAAIPMDYQGSKYPQVSFRRVEQMDVGRLGALFPEDHQSPAPGRMVQFSMSKDEVWIVKYITFSPSDYLPYEQIRHRLESGFINEVYDRMIQQRIQDAHIEINHKAMDQIKTL